MAIEVYVHPTCTSCRSAEALLRDAGATYQRRDFFTQRFTRAELAEVLQRADLRPSEALSKRSSAYRTLDLAVRDVSEDELLELMVAEPTLLRRPLVIAPGLTVQGFNSGALRRLVASVGIESGER